MAFLPLFCHFISRWGTSLFSSFKEAKYLRRGNSIVFCRYYSKKLCDFLELLLPLMWLILVLILCDFSVTLTFNEERKLYKAPVLSLVLGSLGSMTLYFSKVPRQVQGMPRSCSSGMGDIENLSHSAPLN
jgi:hypothetical protein